MTPEQAKILGKIEQTIYDLRESNGKDHAEIKQQVQHNLDTVESKFALRNGQLQTKQNDCQKMFDERPKLPLILWLFGGVFACLLMIGTMLYTINNSINNHIVAGQKSWMLDHPGQEPIDLRGGKD